MALGLYCHIPFCARSCDFCAFYQEAPLRADLEAYLAGMEKSLRQTFAPSRPVTTVFWGGGTPGLLPAADLARLAASVRDACREPPVEWTIEMAPSTVKADKLQILRDHGVTRISLGVQSFNPTLLDKLGRLHSLKAVYTAIDRIRQAGFENLNLDLIFAVPGQSLEEWEKDLQAALEVGPAHLSTYCLTFEEDTRLWLRMSRGEIRPFDEATEAAFYLRTWEWMEQAGYPQYEVSNFARPGFTCLHNTNTWRMHSWIGVGPSASSQFNNARWTNVADLRTWIDGVENNHIARTDEMPLDDHLLATDALIFGLRMNEGVNQESLAIRFPKAHLQQFAPLWSSLEENGLLEQTSANLRLTTKGRLLADRIGSEILAEAENSFTA